MKLCSMRLEDGTDCTNASGAKTGHVGFGYCYEHDHSPAAEKHRLLVKKAVTDRDPESLKQMIQQEKINPDISMAGYPTLLVYLACLGESLMAQEMLHNGADIRIFDRRALSERLLLKMIENGESGRLLSYVSLYKGKVPFFEAAASNNMLLWWQRYGLMVSTAALAFLLISYVTGYWMESGIILNLTGVLWFLKLYFSGRKRRELPDYHLPLWTFITGAFFVLFADDIGNVRDGLFTITFLLCLGYFLLWINAIIRREESRYRRGVLAVTFAIMAFIFIQV
ncbi:hypothetical protein [Alkalicoccus halolimnae]|uniref:Ankyrin repeat domain-containing protein n=1 Tax=Alkalicoccus halolimnae TaxID=1667239 RepID=A0A5C7F878_9BACI|nr:hypothetical protein [Alkalicoccus halolimnae]TXF85578.1 hypothetical protein FTX54_08290 [Alkalicoccus halolimnae]